MKNKERIAELERRVAELEAQPKQINHYPWWGTTPPVYDGPFYYGLWCFLCGSALTNGHSCPGYIITTTASYSSVVDEANHIVEGAMS